VSAQVVSVFPGARLLYHGDVVEVPELDGLRVTIRNHRTGQFTAVRLAVLAAGAQAATYANARLQQIMPGSFRHQTPMPT
jgi:hypothetical protein